MMQQENPSAWETNRRVRTTEKMILSKNQYNTGTIQSQVNYYFSLGIPVVPIKKNTKQALPGWKDTEPRKLWRGFDHNVAILLGNGLICIDADNAKTVELFEHEFKDHQNLLRIKTRGGIHYYFRCAPKIEYAAYKSITEIDGLKGEFRLKDCLTIAPPSYCPVTAYKDNPELGDHHYYIESGSFENIPQLCPDLLNDLILKYTNGRVKGETTRTYHKNVNLKATTLSIPVKRREINSIITDKIEWLKTATQGQSYTSGKVTYATRSDVYISVISVLVRFGYNVDEIKQLLQGIYGDNRYFNMTYNNVIDWLESHELVEHLHELYEIDHPTKSESVVFKALVSLSYQFLRSNIKTSNAELRKLTGIKHYMTVKNVLSKLEKRGLINNNDWNITIVTNTELSIQLCLDHSINVTIFENNITETLNLEYTVGQNTSKILSVFLSKKNVSCQEIISTLNLSKRMISYHLKKLQNFGIITYEKTGRTKTYHLTENYEIKLYELMSDHMHENHLKITTQQARYYDYLKQSDMYCTLKKQHGPEKALDILKKIIANKSDLV